MRRAALLALSLLLSSPSAAAQFSVKCDRGGWYFLTFDDVSMRVVVESLSGSWYKGRILSASKEEMRFEMLNVGQPSHHFYWNRESNALWRTDDPSGKILWVWNCVSTELRPMLSKYDEIAPRH